MANLRQDLQILRGISKTLRLTVEDEDGERVDLTGATVYFSVKVNVADAAAVISKDSGTPSEITILTQSGDTLGQADIFLVPSDTSGLSPIQHYYDVWVVLASGARHAVVPPASFYIEQAITELP